MKKQIILWFLDQLDLPYYKKLFWKIKLTGNLSKHDDISLSEKNIDIFRHEKANPHKLIKYIELIPEMDKSVIFVNYGKGEVQEGKMEDGLIGLI